MPEFELFRYQFIGGPQDGDIAVDSDHFPWPPPGIIKASGGRYIKVSQTDEIPQQPLGSPLARGATYIFRTGSM